MSALLDESKVAPALSIARHTLAYIGGVGTGITHYDVPAVWGKVLSDCDTKSGLDLVEILLTTHLPLGCESGAVACSVAVYRLIDTSQAVLAAPALKNTLGTFSLGVLPKEAFVIVLDLLTAVLRSPDFDFDRLHTFAVRYLFAFIADAELKSRFSELFDLMAELSKSELGLMAPLQSTLACLHSMDTDGVVYRMVYNLAADPDFNFSELVGAQSAAAADPDERIAQWLAAIVRAMKDDTSIERSLVELVRHVLSK